MTGLHLAPTREYAREVEGLAEHLPRVGLGVLDDLNRVGRAARAPGRAVREAWTFDLPDRLTLRWWPQGIAVRGRVAAITWYDKPAPRSTVRQGSRLTLYDLDTHRYRHVLLVRPTLEDGVPGVKPLRIHAGGLAWHRGATGDLLYVAATNGGLYVCHTDDALRVPDGSRLPTSGYRYVLPIRQRLRTEADEGHEHLRYSFVSVEESTGVLAAGEHTDGSGSRRLARFALDPGSGLPTLGADGRAEALSVHDGVVSMQGVAVVDGVQHVTASHGRLRRGSVWSGAPGALVEHRAAAPMGCEDLEHTPGTDDLWTVTEHPLARWIVTMARSTLA